MCSREWRMLELCTESPDHDWNPHSSTVSRLGEQLY